MNNVSEWLTVKYDMICQKQHEGGNLTFQNTTYDVHMAITSATVTPVCLVEYE
jgi:hypothetical protein